MPTPVYLYCLDFPNGKKYVGLTQRPARRFRDHRGSAAKGNNPVQKAIRKYGMPPLRVLCAGTKEYIADLEIKAIAAFQTRNADFGYNVSLGGDLSPSLVPEVAAKISSAQRNSARNLAHLAKLSAANKGQKRPPLSPEHRAKLGAASRGRKCGPMSPEQRAKISSGQKGRKLGPMSPERRAKLSARHMGKPGTRNGMVNTPETRAKLSAALKGRKHTPEHRANNSAAKKGRPLWSPEQRAHMSITRTGRKLRPHSPETRAKISAAKKGHKQSLETRAKKSATMKGRPFSAQHIAAIKAAKDAKRKLHHQRQLSLFQDDIP